LLVKHEVSTLPVTVGGLQIPEQVLQRRVVSSDSAVVLQGLIKWSGMPWSLATWEDLEALHQRFPRAPAWGQAGSKGGGDVTAAATTTGVGPSAVAQPATAARQALVLGVQVLACTGRSGLDP